MRVAAPVLRKPPAPHTAIHHDTNARAPHKAVVHVVVEVNAVSTDDEDSLRVLHRPTLTGPALSPFPSWGLR